MTAREMISSSLRLIGVLASGESPNSNEANDALSVFNQMLGSWSNENLVINQKVREEFTLTPNTSSYTWGTGGTFNSTRPIEVLEAKLELQTSEPQEIPLRILTTKEYADIGLKETSSTYPHAVYFDGAYPLLGVTFYPVPSSAEKAVFYSLKPFSTLTLNTELSFPPGYERAIRFNLAIDLCSEYGAQPSQLVLKTAIDSKAEIKRKNIQAPKLKIELPLTSRKNSFDYRTGE